MTIPEFFAAHGCEDPAYLGDGLYLAWGSRYDIVLAAEREGGIHYVALDLGMVDQLTAIVEKRCERAELPEL